MSIGLSQSARRARRLALFGGSFDPVHAAHLACARLALEHGDVDHVVFIPAARSPLKAQGPTASGPERIAMLETALEGMEHCSTWDVEIVRPAPSYSVDTVRALLAERASSPPSRLCFLLGGDHLEALPLWREVETLFELSEPLVVSREATTKERIQQLEGRVPQPLVARLLAGLIEAEPIELSSSELRQRLAAGQDPGAALPAGVWNFIRGRGLYRR